MFNRRIAASAISISRIRLPVRLPGPGAPALIPIISRNFHNDGIPKSEVEPATRKKVAMEEAERHTIERANEADAREKIDANDGERKEERKKRKTVAEMDEELMAKMEGREGAAGISYDGGKPVTDGFGRGVKSNMFRVI
ncbi:8d2d2894-9d40-429a-98bd-6e3a16e65c83 [Sclerotinia trifoliorum]|uniref:8d2d2894-9d40-429a-98bd-6e3a16e65c83 n=1 Tax=Sclerotinia trifoliorum TaxID=28548 RepID=A0A8H2VRX1_9HELO|nr:8d2d2894-9d40-429a-98bd-6e3a16e65c83 [Sclerotinia trifoliorum]